MKVVIQKSGPASVIIEGATKREISSGLVILLGITKDDTEKDIDYLIDCLLYTSPSPRDVEESRMPSSA